MKIRMDFVSNSSSSSFVLARKGELSEKQKEAVIRFVEEQMLGKPLPPIKEGEGLDDYCDRVECWMNCSEKEVRKARDEGMTLYGGSVDFDECSYSYSRIFQALWDVIEKADDDSGFIQLDTDLSY